MPKKFIFFLSSTCVMVSILILFVSLVVSSPVYRFDGTNNSGMMGRKFYLGRKILPDNIFYPVFNFPDKLFLSLAKEEMIPWLELDLSKKRLNDATILYRDNQESANLTLLTLNKSHSYLLQAGDSLLELPSVSEGELTFFSQSLEDRDVILKDVSVKMTDSQRARIDEMRAEEKQLLLKMKNRYSQVLTRHQVKRETKK